MGTATNTVSEVSKSNFKVKKPNAQGATKCCRGIKSSSDPSSVSFLHTIAECANQSLFV